MLAPIRTMRSSTIACLSGRARVQRKEEIMKFMLLIYGNERAEAKRKPAENEAVFGAYMAYGKAMREAGAYVDGAPLLPSTTARTVQVRKSKTAKRTGPAFKTKEALGGYYIIEVKSAAEAAKWAAKCPGAKDGSVEVRPLMPMG